MKFLSGIISDHVRSIFAKGDPAYSPPADRSDSPSKGQRIPKNAAGTQLSKPGRTTKK